jgi:hypothetical protein
MCDELNTFQDMLYYHGVYYGDWSVFGSEVFKKGQFQESGFDQDKAKLPTKSCS